MDVASARELALVKLRQLEDPEYPLVLDPKRGPQELAWCWVFPFNTAQYVETADLLDSVLSGPIIVNKDSSQVWVVDTSRPAEELLEDYAASRGYARLQAPLEIAGGLSVPGPREGDKAGQVTSTATPSPAAATVLDPGTGGPSGVGDGRGVHPSGFSDSDTITEYAVRSAPRNGHHAEPPFLRHERVQVQTAPETVDAETEASQFPAVRPVQPVMSETKPALRVSGDGTLAINAATGPQEFYATDEVVRRANDRLRDVWSAVTLVAQPWHTITLQHESGPRTLVRVVPEFADGLPSAPSRDFAVAVLGGRPDLTVSRPPGSATPLLRPFADELGGARDNIGMDARNAEPWAEVGEGYAAPNYSEPLRGGINRYRFEAVVAKSEDGRAQITLENDSDRAELARAAADAVTENVKRYTGRLDELRDRLRRAASPGDRTDALRLELVDALADVERLWAQPPEQRNLFALAKSLRAAGSVLLALVRPELTSGKELWEVRMNTRSGAQSVHNPSARPGGRISDPHTAVVLGLRPLYLQQISFAHGSSTIDANDTLADKAVAQAARYAVRLAAWRARNGLPPPTVVVTGQGNGAATGNRARRAYVTGLRRAEAVRYAIRAEISRLTTVDIPVHAQSAGRDIVAAPSGHDSGRQLSPEQARLQRRTTFISILASMGSIEAARSPHQPAVWTPSSEPDDRAIAAATAGVPGFLVVAGRAHDKGGLRGAPTMDELAEQIRRLPGWDERPIILMSGKIGARAAALSRRLGVDVVGAFSEVFLLPNGRLVSGNVDFARGTTPPGLLRGLALLLKHVAEAGVWAVFKPDGAVVPLPGPDVADAVAVGPVTYGARLPAPLIGSRCGGSPDRSS